MTANLEKQLQRVYWGKIDFRDFVFGTRSEFAALAHNLVSRWPSPAWFTVDDAEQELYLGVWKYVWLFDETRGVKIKKFVVFNSYQSAKIALHKARGVTISGIPDKKLSNFELPLSAFGEEGDGDILLERLFSEPCLAEDIIIDAEERIKAVNKLLPSCETKEERFMVLAVREAGSIDAASQLLYDDVDFRTTLRLNSEEHADKFVAKHAKVLAKRLVLNECVKST